MTTINDLHDMFLKTIWPETPEDMGLQEEFEEAEGNYSDFISRDQLENAVKGSVML